MERFLIPEIASMHFKIGLNVDLLMKAWKVIVLFAGVCFIQFGNGIIQVTKVDAIFLTQACLSLHLCSVSHHGNDYRW